MVSFSRCRWWLLGLACLPAQSLIAEPGFAPRNQNRQDEAHRTDQHGDALPAGAVARMGTLRFRNPRDRVSSVAFSPDGQTVAACYHDMVFLWDLASGKELHRLRKFSGNDRVKFSPDGKVLASTNYSAQTMHLWDVASGKELHRFRIWAGPLAFAPDGRTVAAGSYGILGSRGKKEDYVGEIYLWDVASGKELRRFKGHQERVLSIAIAPDGKTLASGSGDGTIRLWDLATGAETRRIPAHQGFVYALALSPGGTILASGSGYRDDGTIRLWDVNTGRELRQLHGHEKKSGSWMYEIAFAPDGRTLVSADGTGTRIHWDAASGRELGRFGQPPIRTHDLCFPIAFSPDGKILAGRERSHHVVCFWDATTRRKIQPLEEHNTSVDTLAVSPDGRVLATSCLDDEVVRLWEVSTGKHLLSLPGHRGGAVGVAFAADGKTLATGNNRDARFRVWDAASGDCLHTLETPPPQGRAFNDIFGGRTDMCLAYSADGTILATGTRDGMITFWDPATGKQLLRFLGHPGGVDEEGERYAAGPLTTLIFSAAEPIFISRNDYQHFWLRRVGNGKKLWDLTFEGPKKTNQSYRGEPRAALSPNAKVLAVGGGSLLMSVELLEIATGKPRHQIVDHDSGVTALAIAPDGRTLAVGTEKGTLRLWDLFAGQELGRIAAHQTSIRGIVFTPQGRQVITASADSTALVWEVAALVKPPAPAAVAWQPQQIQGLWNGLASSDPQVGFQAVRDLSQAPVQAVALLRRQLRPVPAIDPKHISRLIADLDSPNFTDRQQAFAELEKLGDLAEPALKQVLTELPPLEVRQRVEQLVERLCAPISNPDTLRVLRALEVLEACGAAEALPVLEDLAQGAAGARLTREARGALDRLKKTRLLAPAGSKER